MSNFQWRNANESKKKVFPFHENDTKFIENCTRVKRGISKSEQMFDVNCGTINLFGPKERLTTLCGFPGGFTYLTNDLLIYSIDYQGPEKYLKE